MRFLPTLWLQITALTGFWSCHWDRHEVRLWLSWGQSRVEHSVPIPELVMVVWSAPPFFLFSVPASSASFVEIVEPFASFVVAFVLVGFVRQVQFLELVWLGA